VCTQRDGYSNYFLQRSGGIARPGLPVPWHLGGSCPGPGRELRQRRARRRPQSRGVPDSRVCLHACQRLGGWQGDSAGRGCRLRVCPGRCRQRFCPAGARRRPGVAAGKGAQCRDRGAGDPQLPSLRRALAGCRALRLSGPGGLERGQQHDLRGAPWCRASAVRDQPDRLRRAAGRWRSDRVRPGHQRHGPRRCTDCRPRGTQPAARRGCGPRRSADLRPQGDSRRRCAPAVRRPQGLGVVDDGRVAGGGPDRREFFVRVRLVETSGRQDPLDRAVAHSHRPGQIGGAGLRRACPDPGQPDAGGRPATPAGGPASSATGRVAARRDRPGRARSAAVARTGRSM
ncbi:Delta 1-piperideine-2-carboxylate reductase (NAD(P)H) (EC 1.5.1.1) @ Delta 1-pyrroline-2-carboxylate reductase (NAD(P)H) (EC 1.5.1.1), partial [Pseudomonas sp. FEN]